jgi:spermidine dehydrogenase
MRLAWGGTVNIEHWKYSEVGNRLLREIGVDIDRLLADFEYDWGSSGTGLAEAVFFDEATYGRDTLLAGMTSLSRENLLAMGERIPISEAGRRSLLRFAAAEGDLLATLSEEERERLLHGTRYTDFLREHGGLTEDAIQIFGNDPVGSWGIPAWELSVAEALESELPGAHLLGVDPEEFEEDDHRPSAMFPDGNASIARLLVRQLIPAAFPAMGAGDDPFSIVTADLDYGELDRASSPARLRLNSTVLRVTNRDGGVDVHYARAGTLHAVRARQCIMACYNRIIPHLCPELPEEQKAGLAQCIKRPMGTINVELRNGRAIAESGVASASLPGSMLGRVGVVNGINAGPYRSEWDPDAPCILHFFFGIGAEDPTGLDMVEQSQAGRLRLLGMSFDDFETEVHRILRGIWGPAGLDVERDILAITVNPWPHGYARDLVDLEDPAWLAKPGPHEIGRRPCGNIAIANSDAGADAYTHTAIDQAWRAVNDLPARSA